MQDVFCYNQLMTPAKEFEILIGPDNRNVYLTHQIAMDGLAGVVEDPTAAYCAVSLTNTPSSAKSFVTERQTILKEILEAVKITPYDPATAPLSPDLNLTTGPEEVYRTDLSRVAGARFFTAFDTFPSTGVGVEIEAARRYNRIPVILHDHTIRTSRMQPDCAIHVSVKDIKVQKERLQQLFAFLREFTPGRGIDNQHPLLLGFKDGKGINLTKAAAKEFPDLVYMYDGTKPPLTFSVDNFEVL